MSDFTQHTIDSAPEESRPLLADAQKKYGRIPGLLATMAESPQLLDGYQKMRDLFVASSFDAEEMTVVWQTINVDADCHYCVPAHTAIAKAMKVDDRVTDALRNETPLPTARLEALRTFTLAVVRERGFARDAVGEFLAAGFTRRNVLEVIVGLSQKVMSNYTNHLAQTPLDAQFAQFAWTKRGANDASAA